MRLRKSLTIGVISACISISAWITAPEIACSQESPSVSMVTLQVVPGSQGQSVITPRGMMVPLPGPGVNGNSIQVYMGSQGGYWYVDKNGQNYDLTSYVARMRAMQGGMGQQAQQVPQYAPAPEPVVINNQQTAPSSTSSGYGAAGMMMGTAAAAGLGAMAGSAMSNDYYHGGYYGNVPYGTPVHYPAGGAHPYYVNASGNSVNVNRSYTGGTATATQNNVNAAHVNENEYNNMHASNMEAQSKWYQNQQKANPEQFKSWQQNSAGENPFVNRDAQSRYGGAATAQGEGGRFGGAAQGGAAQGEAGRFGGGAAQGEAGRFGGGAAAESGGRFGRGAEASGGGGRFGGRLGGGEGGGGGGRFRRGGR